LRSSGQKVVHVASALTERVPTTLFLLIAAALTLGSQAWANSSDVGISGRLWAATLPGLPAGYRGSGDSPQAACNAAVAASNAYWGVNSLAPGAVYQTGTSPLTYFCPALRNGVGTTGATVGQPAFCIPGYRAQDDGSCQLSPLPTLVQACAVSHPVIPGTGAKILSELAGISSAELPITYAYRSQGVYGSAGGAGQWILNWQRSLDTNFPTYLPLQVTSQRESGVGFAFKNNGTVWSADGTRDTLKQITDTTGKPSGWQYIAFDTNTVETYDVGGKLQSVRDRNGRATTLTYNSQNRLTRVTAPSGRSLTFAYDPQGRVSSITAPDGAITQYAYNANGMLTTVTWPDNTTRQTSPMVCVGSGLVVPALTNRTSNVRPDSRSRRAWICSGCVMSSVSMATLSGCALARSCKSVRSLPARTVPTTFHPFLRNSAAMA